MAHLQPRNIGNHARSADLFWRMGNAVTQQTQQNMENHGDQAEGRVELRPHVVVDESDIASPPMWKTSSPTENSQLQSHYKSYQLLSPVSRSQAIARGQQELMDMIKDMPESSYELSLRDIVEQPIAQRLGQVNVIKETESNNESLVGSKKRKNWSKKEYEKKKQSLRIGSMSSEPFLLSMLFPTSWGLKNEKNSKMGPCSKFCSRPKVNLREGKKSIDKNWWRKGFSVAGGNENSGSESKSSSRSNSINRNTGDLLPGCLSFIYAKAKPWERKATPFERDAM